MSEIDFKTTKVHYPRTNNESVLEFVYPRDPNLFLRKNKIAIRGYVEVPEHYLPDNAFAAKVRPIKQKFIFMFSCFQCSQ